MLLTVSEFRQRVLGPDLDRLLIELVDLTGRDTREERKAWADSFTRLALTLDGKAFGSIHLYLGDIGNLSLEYRLPASCSWCDLVLLGNDGQQPHAVILELKHWDTRRDSRVLNSGLIDRPGGLTLHPSEQVRGYTEYCQSFHSAIHESAAVVNGCVVFTAFPLNPVYRTGLNPALAETYPCFSVANSQGASEAISYLNLRLVRPDYDFARRFETGHYRQDRSFIHSVGETLRRSPNRRLVLLDEQRTGLCISLAAVQQAIADEQGATKKRVVIIEGPPGSGKSAIAAHLWAELATDPAVRSGNLAFVTSSTVQNHCLEHLFGAGRGAVKKATQFSPCTPVQLGKLKRQFPGQFDDVSNWRGNLDLLRKLKGEFTPGDDSYLVTVVDEAHALVNPESRDARGAVGFPVNFGPSGYHIIRSSVVSVFLLDDEQGFRDQETTTRSEIEKWARELGAEVMPAVSLEHRQFRCGGSAEYIDWIDGVLSAESIVGLKKLAAFWREDLPSHSVGSEELQIAEDGSSKLVPFPNPRHRFAFELVDSPAELEAALAAHHRGGETVRLVSSFARKWVTERAARPHELPPSMQDFCLRWSNQSGAHTWSRIWNWRDAPEGYVGWIDPAPGVPMAANPLAEIGCPYTVRGFDYDYLGILWLSDVVWRSDHWEVVPENVHERGLKRHRQRAAREVSPNDPHHRALLHKLLQGYRILLSRALKGVYVWCEDGETRTHLGACFSE